MFHSGEIFTGLYGRISCLLCVSGRILCRVNNKYMAHGGSALCTGDGWSFPSILEAWHAIYALSRRSNHLPLAIDGISLPKMQVNPMAKLSHRPRPIVFGIVCSTLLDRAPAYEHFRNFFWFFGRRTNATKLRIRSPCFAIYPRFTICKLVAKARYFLGMDWDRLSFS